MNCVYNCRYCFLKGTFENNFPVIFVNDEEMQGEMNNFLSSENYLPPSPLLETKRGNEKLVLYASNYSDLLAMEGMTGFHRSWIPFFEQFEGVMMESRTKCGNIQPLLDLWFVPKHTEIAFSLNPQEIINHYEK